MFPVHTNLWVLLHTVLPSGSGRVLKLHFWADSQIMLSYTAWRNRRSRRYDPSQKVLEQVRRASCKPLFEGRRRESVRVLPRTELLTDCLWVVRNQKRSMTQSPPDWEMLLTSKATNSQDNEAVWETWSLCLQLWGRNAHLEVHVSTIYLATVRLSTKRREQMKARF